MNHICPNIYTWEMRKCEKIIENMFIITFLKMQSTTWKYFSEVLENNFFPKIFSSKNILWLENIFYWIKHCLNIFFSIWLNFFFQVKQTSKWVKDWKILVLPPNYLVAGIWVIICVIRRFSVSQNCCTFKVSYWKIKVFCVSITFTCSVQHSCLLDITF